jgi:hypothetical protein
MSFSLSKDSGSHNINIKRVIGAKLADADEWYK